MYDFDRSNGIMNEFLEYYKIYWNPKILIDDFFKIEKKYNKYLYEFDKKELLELFNLIENQTRLVHARRFISNYLDFCYIKGYTNLENTIKKDKMTIDYLMSKNDNINIHKVWYISNSLYKTYISKFANSSNDLYFKTIFMAIYEGILGKEFENLALLSWKDIDIQNNLVYLHSGIKLRVSDELVKNLLRVHSIDELKKNKRTLNLYDILDTDAIFKSATKIKERGTYESKLLCAKRKFAVYISQNISDIVENEDLTAIMIYNSGLVNYVLNNLRENNENLGDDIAIQKYLIEFGIDMSPLYFKKRFAKYIQLYYKDISTSEE